MINKPYPQKSLKMGKYFALKANMDSAEMTPEVRFDCDCCPEICCMNNAKLQQDGVVNTNPAFNFTESKA